MSTARFNTLSNAAGSKSVPVDTVVDGSAKAWVNFNGASGTSPFTLANGGIRAAFNVSSITDNGVGDYTINFTTAMPDANYAVTLTAFDSASGTYVPKVLSSGNSTSAPSLMSTTAVRIAFGGGTSQTADVGVFSAAIFR